MGVDALLCETPTPYSVTALTSVIILRFPEEQVARALASDRQLSLAMLGSFSADLLLSHTRQKAPCHIAEHDCGRIDVYSPRSVVES
jgi:CRP-like cAMP-binding protein